MASLVAAKPCLVRPAAKAQRVVKPRHVALRATAPKKEDIAAAIAEAEETCQGGSTGECAAAWDTVEELSAAAAHAKADAASPSNDPLEKFCDDNPDADECRVYDD